METHGKILWFNDSIGYGLIDKEDGGAILEHFTTMSPLRNKLPGECEDLKSDWSMPHKGPNAPHLLRLIPSKSGPESGR